MSLLSFPRCRVAEGTGTFDILQLPWETLLPGAGVPQGLHAAGMLQGFLLRGQRWLSFSPWVSYHPTQRCPGLSICQRRDERSASGGQCSRVSYPRGMRAGRDERPRGSTAVPREHCWFCRTPLPAAPAAPAQSQPRAGARRASSPHHRDRAAPGTGTGREGAACGHLRLLLRLCRAEGWSAGPAGGCQNPKGLSSSWERMTSLTALKAAGAQAGGHRRYLEMPEATSPAGEGSEEGIPPDAPLLGG